MSNQYEMVQQLPDKNRNFIMRTVDEWKKLALLGAPILIAQLAQMANGVMDTVMAGHASAEDLAGVGIGTSLWVPTLLFFAGILGALQPTISGHYGAKDLQKIMPVLWQGIYIALAAMVVMILLITNMNPIFRLLQLDDGTARIAEGYLDAFAWGTPALLLMATLRGLTDGLSHTRVIMIFSLLSTILNLPLNYIFIYGFDFVFFKLPAFGGIGCGWATSISNWIACIGLIVYLNANNSFKQFRLLEHWILPIRDEIKNLLKLGIPIGFSSFIEVSMFCMIGLFLAPLGTTTMAGHQIVLNAVPVLFMLPMSLGIALTLRISFMVGAQEYNEAHTLVRSAMLLAIMIGCVNGLFLFLGRDWLASLYTSDIAVQKIAAQLFILGAIFQIADVIQVTMICVLRGFKDTRIPMLIMLISFWGISLPLGYVLTFRDWITAPMGAQGFWTALIAGLIFAACLMTMRAFKFHARQYQ